MAMLSPAPANQRPAFRSRDLPRPIRGQGPIRGPGSSPVIISDENINHHYNCEAIRQTSVNTLQCLETSESQTSSSNITIRVQCLSFSLILFASLSNTGDKRCTKFWITNKLLRTNLLSVCLISFSLLWLTCTQHRENENIQMLCEDRNKNEKESLNRMKNTRQISLMGQGVMRINWA